MGLPDIYCWPGGPAEDLKDPNYPNNPPPDNTTSAALKGLCYLSRF